MVTLGCVAMQSKNCLTLPLVLHVGFDCHAAKPLRAPNAVTSMAHPQHRKEPMTCWMIFCLLWRQLQSHLVAEVVALLFHVIIPVLCKVHFGDVWVWGGSTCAAC